MSDNWSERRNIEPRVRRRLMARFGVHEAKKTAFTMNLSLTGAFLKTNDVIKPGTTIQVRLEFPTQPFSLWARVVWAKKVPPQLAHVLNCGMGVRFVNPGVEWESFYNHWRESNKI